MKTSWLVISFFLGAFACFAQDSERYLYEGIEFDMPEVVIPTFPDYQVNISDLGARGDGVTLCTDMIAQSIDRVVANGGGTVIIPRGIWLTGPITLKSNVNLHLTNGALLLFTDDKNQYPLVSTSFEGLDTYRCLSPINGRNLENVAITGNGTIDGNGDAWRSVKRSKMSESQWRALLNKGGILNEEETNWYPSESFRRGAEATSGFFNVPKTTSMDDFQVFKDFLRPVMVSIVNSKKVLLDGPTFQNSPAWNLHPLMCEHVTIRNLTVRNPWYSQNGDGLDLESCKNVLIYNNKFDVGDDAICIKSGKNEDGRRRGVPTENVIIKNNVVYHGHGGFVVGSEMSGGVRNVHVSQCTFMGTDTGLRFKSTRGRGGVVEHIYISDIDMLNIPTEPIRFNLFYGGQSPVLEDDQEAAVVDENPVPVSEETPSFKDIYMKNIRAIGCESAGYFQGLPEMNLQNITIEDSQLKARKGINLIDADGVTFTNVSVDVEQGFPLTIYNGQNIDLENVRISSIKSAESKVRLMGIKTNNVLVKGLAKNQIEEGENVPRKALKIK